MVLEERGLLQVVQVNARQLEIVAEWDLSEDSGERPGIHFPCWAAPVIIGNQILVRGTDRILCLEFATRQSDG